MKDEENKNEEDLYNIGRHIMKLHNQEREMEEEENQKEVKQK